MNPKGSLHSLAFLSLSLKFFYIMSHVIHVTSLSTW